MPAFRAPGYSASPTTAPWTTCGATRRAWASRWRRCRTGRDPRPIRAMPSRTSKQSGRGVALHRAGTGPAQLRDLKDVLGHPLEEIRLVLLEL